MKKFVFICLGMVLAVSAGVAQKKKEITVPVSVSYCLPKVMYQVKVKAEVVRYIPGPYAEHAAKELGMKPESLSLKERWRVASVEVEPFYVPDESAVYMMTASGEYSAVMLNLSPEGFLAGVAAGMPNTDVAGERMERRFPATDSRRMIDMTKLRTYNPLKEVLDTNYTEQEIDGVMKRIWDPIVRYETKTKKDLMEEAVKEIFRIRSERVKLLSADNEVADGKSLEVILKEFDRMEKDYLSLFMGTEVKRSVERVFTCTLDKPNEQVVAFRFSESEGFVDKKDVSVSSYVLVAEQVVVPPDKKAVPVEGAQSVIYYRVPAVANVKLIRMGEELQQFRSVIPQLGVIRKFPTEVIAVEGLQLEFYPEYGSIKSIGRGVR
ncbi:DUF4831 family protein [Odoribacter lunatus]|uniref:DUF4831 family protein n=1 Tax=Odoribacter lunatus TaxID=2941335 RepID=UPI00203C3642|nr:DUF4831 family protein [Odoribacter lunatus]